MARVDENTRKRRGRRIGAFTAAAVALIAAGPAAATAAPHLTSVRCYSECLGYRTVAPGGRIEILGDRLGDGMRVILPVRSASGGAGGASVKTRLTSSHTLVARTPREAESGELVVETSGGARSNGVRVRVGSPTATGLRPRGSSAYDSNGMWIWYVSHSGGGSPSAIASKARSRHVRTVYVKSGDGTHYWSQFSRSFVAALEERGLQVCAWQFVYGRHPKTEASVAARAIRAGANCFVIDAESQYEGRYSAARKYVTKLRSAAGRGYPLALAGFPYVDYHPAFPYSVFLGPGGAQYNLPQVYWKDIGGGVDKVMKHAYRWNRPYDRPIYPLGQLYNNPRRSEILRFRQLSKAQGATGLSWWDWQEATAAGWRAIAASVKAAPGAASQQFPTLRRGAKGDVVVWAQQHLRAAGRSVAADGRYGSKTRAAVKRFQQSAGLEVTGNVNARTWVALLRYQQPSQRAKAASLAPDTATPKSAHLAPRRNEIPPPSRRH